MTPVEEIRRAAQLMRQRAQVADDGLGWDHHMAAIASSIDEADEHVASWHPGVALAVADWLDAEANPRTATRAGSHALIAARAYLGGAS